MIKLCLFTAAAALICLIGLRLLEDRLLYFPIKNTGYFPDQAGMAYQNVDFKSADGMTLNGWWLAGDNAKATILFCHGNGGNIGHRLHKLKILRRLGYAVFIFDYRGYGASVGRPTESGFYADAEAAAGVLADHFGIPPRRVILYGESLGGAVAVELGRRRPFRAIILEDTFTSIRQMTRKIFPWIPGFLIRNQYDSLVKIKNIRTPKLIIHSIDDEIIPFSMGQVLLSAAPAPKQFLQLRGTHNTAFLDSEKAYRQGLSDFIDNL